MLNNSLDPEDWDEIKALGHQMVEEILTYLQNIRNTPVWQPIPEEVKQSFNTSIPHDGEKPDNIYKEFQNNILPYNKGNVHPRFWAWVQGTGTPLGVLADLLASGMNPNATIGEHSAMYVDKQVINWCKEIMGFPLNASGMLLSGGSMANTTALIVARNTMMESIRQSGVKAYPQQAVVYASKEVHSCIQKSVEVIGLGSENLRKIDTNSDFTINIQLLENTILKDIEEGKKPMCIVATVGTVNTGAIDDLKSIRALCDKYKMWMHIDGAFGALAILVPEYKNQTETISIADSVAFDLHKWLYMPYEVGCVLINKRDNHRSAFAISPEYLLNHEFGLAAGPDPLNHYGIELSRGFKALKVWMSIKEHGIDAYAKQIEKNILQARYLGKLIEKYDSLHLMADISLNIVCFRYFIHDLSPEELNLLNKNIVMTIQHRGIASPSSTIIDSNYVIRVAITNHRSLQEDFDIFIKAVLDLGQEFSTNSSKLI